jgi:RHS repeat-associated protein
VKVNLHGSETITTFISNIDYNSKGQRELIEYGNSVRTTYKYDKLTFRLTHLKTLRESKPLQDLSYTYDPSGNITFIKDDALQTIYFSGAVIKPGSDYTYDAIYRLIESTGREHIGQASLPWTTWNDEFRTNLQHPNDGKAMRGYRERYEYDEVGNFLRFVHYARDGSWVRSYAYEEPSLIEPCRKNNRLSKTFIGSGVENYTYDAHGSMTSMPHLPKMAWDFKEELQMVDKGGGCRAYYVYDTAGQRVRKIIEENGTRQKERIYLDGFEVYREFSGNGTLKLERETLHIMDDEQRIALVETRTQGDDPAPEELIRYQFGNHLNSTILELDDQAQIISYEEYYPYGSTSYQAVRNQTETPKRYRYTGKERDEESGMYYHVVRYYAPWLGRWTSTDTFGFIDGINLYSYVGNNPIIFSDTTGHERDYMVEEYGAIQFKTQEGKFVSIYDEPPQIEYEKPAPSKPAKPKHSAHSPVHHTKGQTPAPSSKKPEPPPKNSKSATGSPSTWLDKITRLSSYLAPPGVSTESSEKGVSGGIPGGKGPTWMANSVGQIAYIAINVIFTFLGESIGKAVWGSAKVAAKAVWNATKAAWNVSRPFLSEMVKAPAYMFVGAGGIGGGGIPRLGSRFNRNVVRQNAPYYITRYNREKAILAGENRFAVFSKQDLYPHGQNDVNIGLLTGSRGKDFTAANKVAGYPRTPDPKNYVWHHHEDLGRMQLVKRSVHDKIRIKGQEHLGGVAIWKRLFNLTKY